MTGDRLRVRRQRLGLSQGDLAARAGVSRQLVAAVEAGRNDPSVTAALALAQTLGCTVEALFTPAPGNPAGPVLPGTAPPALGTPLAAARVADRLVWAPLTEPSGTGFQLADAVWSGAGPQLLDGATGEGFVITGCEPALSTASATAPGGAGRLLVVHAATGPAVAALQSGRAHAAVVHGPPADLPRPPPRTRRWELARWPVGLGYRGSPPAAADLAAGRVPVAQREEAAASQQALRRALGGDAEQRLPGPVAAGHLACAGLVASGEVPAGVTTGPAAAAYRLGFSAWEEHVVQLWVDQQHAAHPGLATLLQAWSSRRLRSQLQRLGGYELAHAGTEVS